MLQRTPLLRSLPEGTLLTRAGPAQLTAMTRGETLFRRGGPGTVLLVVAMGRIRLSVPSTEGHDGVLNLERAVGVVSEIALLDGPPAQG